MAEEFANLFLEALYELRQILSPLDIVDRHAFLALVRVAFGARVAAKPTGDQLLNLCRDSISLDS